MLGRRQSMCILLQGLYSTGLLKLMPVLPEGRNQTCSSTSALPVFLYAHFKSSSEGNSCAPHPPESILTSTCTCTCSSPLCVFWQTHEQRRPMEAAWHYQWLLPHHTLPRDRDWTAQKLPGTNTRWLPAVCTYVSTYSCVSLSPYFHLETFQVSRKTPVSVPEI